MLFGGSRSGKTFVIVRAIFIRAIKAPNSRHLITRYRFNAVRASVWLDTLPKVQRLCFPDIQYKDHRQDNYIELPNGAQIWFGGLDEKERIEKILGNEYSTIFVNECSQVVYSSILVLLTRLAQVINMADGRILQQKLFSDMNPVGKAHWSYGLFIEKKDPVERRSLRDPENYQSFCINPKDNTQNLAPNYLAALAGLPERSRKRFFDGKFVEEVDGALWPSEIISRNRRTISEVPTLRRVIIAVDPSGARSEDDMARDEIGIVAMGIGDDGHGYVLGDYTFRGSPAQWGKKVAWAYDNHKADRVVGEGNFGGAMVEFVVSTANENIPVVMVVASRGKAVRAEPISQLYELDKIHHVGEFRELEDEMEATSTSGYTGEGSPNRMDALVWAATDLFGINDSDGLNVINYMKMMSQAVTSDEEAGISKQPWENYKTESKITTVLKAENIDDLSDYYQRAVDEFSSPNKGCKRCGQPIIGSKVSDGVDSWHVNCRPR